MKKPLTKTDVFIVGAALLLCAAAFIAIRVRNAGSAKVVNIYVDGELYQSVPLGEERTILVERDGKTNAVAVDARGVWMLYASCPNHDCVEQGKLTPDNIATRPLGNSIICIPNKVTVELTEGE